MIDTLETSIKLEASGFTNDQAKALTEVIANNESIEIKRINKKIDVLDNNIEHKFDVLDNKIEHKFDVLDNNIRELQKNVDHKFEKVDEKFEKFRTEFTSQSRWIIGLIVTLIIAVGILNFI